MVLLRSLTPEQWRGRALTPAGTSVSAWKWARAMVEHEAHHRGQVYFLLGLLGVATPPIFGLTEPEVLERSDPGVQRPRAPDAPNGILDGPIREP